MGALLVRAAALLLVALSQQLPPPGYELEDPNAQHDWVAKELANANRLPEAIESFKAAARFVGEHVSFANLGVAYMRNKEFGLALKALRKAMALNPDDGHAKENLEVLQTFAQSHGYDKKKLEALGRRADLDLIPKNSRAERGAEPEEGLKGPRSMRILTTAAQIGTRAKELFARGEKKLGRGFLSLALHVNPWVSLELPWVDDVVSEERSRMTYWAGNAFLGWDKTKVEDVINAHFKDQSEPEVYELALYAWRNLQLVKHSCCGIDNVAVFLSRARKFAHPHVVPFLHLTPDYVPKLKPENKAMYNSFKQWWENNGRRSPPPPAIGFDGKDSWDWESMKVVMPPDRVPDGWEVFTQAALLYRLNEYEGARASLAEALRINSEIALASDELMPGFASFPARPGVMPPAARGKYLVCYNPQVGLGNIAVVMVSALNLARITGRTLVIHWNTNMVSRHAWELLDLPGVKLIGEAVPEMRVQDAVKSIYLFHMMDSGMLASVLELLGCSDLATSLSEHRIVTLSSNLYFTPILQTNPHLSSGYDIAPFSQGLQRLMTPSAKAKKRALSYANKTAWASAPVVAVHIRAREEGEDNDDWPTAESPQEELLASLTKCIEQAVHLEFGDVKTWDVYLAATTDKARKVVSEHLKQSSPNLGRILSLPKLERNRRTGAGTVDAMAEALLLSRADIFVRFVVGTTGFSTFAYLANALRFQSDWASSLPPLRREGYAPNYVVTAECGHEHRCFEAPAEVRMADVSWHGKYVTGRSCGDVVARLKQKIGCPALKPASLQEEEEL
ncbi:unnamed protein product [Effrenium voratum]|uniref:Uncharacterized protein n=1 Tax=Effrenium voratum TaxID=2562239 RepID=A0AA36J2K7_9DINO|nr:unnamed protein product [Effrenium voratum]CAJ1437186.1 unnamed protein product [Effrenium voratum]